MNKKVSDLFCFIKKYYLLCGPFFPSHNSLQDKSFCFLVSAFHSALVFNQVT